MSIMSEEEIHILITVQFPESLVERIRSVSPRLVLHQYPVRELENLSEDLLGEIEIIYAGLSLPDTDDMPKLRWIQFHYAGIDQLSDHPVMDSDITLTTMSGASAPQMAEFAIVLMLAIGHHFPGLIQDPPDTRWSDDRYTRYEPSELRESTIGVVGYGSVGREIARICQAFGAKILAIKGDLKHLTDEGYTLKGLGDPEAELPDRIYPPQAIRSMVELCDYVVVTTPLTAQTRGMVNREVLDAMKSNAYLIDVSRGGIVDHGALVEVLNERKIAGAALDVYPIEPLPDSSPLWKMDNVILTPHIAGASKQYLERAVQLFTLNLHRFLAERPLLNDYERSRGY